MAKIIKQTKIQEWKGLDKISTIVHGMSCIFRESSKDDFGVDGEIEISIPAENCNDFEPSGRYIKVQSKAGASYVRQETETSFSTYVNKNDLHHWHRSPYPFLFMVYNPNDEKIYYKELKSYIRRNPNVFQSPCKITFDKKSDEFTVDCYENLIQYSLLSPPRIKREQELFVTNLLPVKTLPKRAWQGTTSYQLDSEIREQISDSCPPFCISEGRLYTLEDLNSPNSVLRSYCDSSDVKEFSLLPGWLDNQKLRGLYIFLLNQLIELHSNSRGLRYQKEHKRYYFPRENENDLYFKKEWSNSLTGIKVSGRIVAKYYQYGKDSFWRHLAANLTFKQFGKKWYLQILPKYFFTSDGKTPWEREKVGPYTTKIKSMERNHHVLNHVLFWADYLGTGSQSIEIVLDNRILLVLQKKPLDGIATFAITDDPALWEEEVDTGQTSLFDLFSDENDGENDEY